MFRVKRVAENSVVLRVAVVLVVVMVAATVATIWLVTEIRKEQRAVQAIVEGGVVEDIERLGTLPGEIRWQFVFTILVLLVLILASSGLVFVVRAYLKSLTSLREIKILAWNILASMDHGVITTDREGTITSVNPRGQQLLGIDFDSIGRPLDDICQNGQPLADASRDLLKSGKSQYNRNFSVTHKVHLVQLRAESHMLRGTDHEVLGSVLHIRDVTESMLIEERMRRMERFMGLGTLAAGLHHEIKNPLSALSLHVQLLEERLEGQADDETAENLGVLKTEVTRIAGVLESFRDYASSERMNLAPADLGLLLQQTVELMRPKAEQQKVHIDLDMPEQPLPQVELDSIRFEQVLLNLVINSLDELHEGGTITLSVSSSDGRLGLEIADTGSGIPDNIRSRIFDPYFTTKSGGSGMGLALCDKIVRQHGGELDLETSSAGTVFRVSLPINDE